MNTNTHAPDEQMPTLGRIDVRQAAVITGFAYSDIAVLIQTRLLRPLGNPGPTAPRFFSAAEIRQLAANRDWLDKAQRAVSQYHRQRNRRRRGSRSAQDEILKSNETVSTAINSYNQTPNKKGN